MNKKQKYILLSIAIALITVTVITPNEANAGIINWFLGAGETAIDATVSFVLGLVRSFLAFTLNLVGNLLTWVIQQQDFFNEGVRAGWTATRDFANLFFALALLFIAIATVVGGPIDNYSAKRMLPTFIFVALLINFSLPIVGVFIDISQIIMIEFYNAIISNNSDGIGGVVAEITDINSLGDVSNQIPGEPSVQDGAFANSIRTLFQIVVLATLIFTVLWTAIALVVRLVTLWIVIMTAPLAFVATLFPPLKGIQKDWMKRFQGALVEGPVVIFILYLGFTVLGAVANASSFTVENMVLVVVLFFLANIQAKQAASAAPAAVTKAVGWTAGAATLGLGAYIGLGGPGTNQLRKDIQKKGKQSVQLADKTVGAGATVIGKNANYDVLKENVKEDVKRGKGPLGFAQLATEDGRKFRYDQSKLGVYEKMRTEGNLTPNAIKALYAADKDNTDAFKDNEDAVAIVEAITKAKNAGQYSKARAGVKRLAQMEQISALFEGNEAYNKKYGSDAAKLDAYLRDELKDSGTQFDDNFRKGLEYTLKKEDQLSYAVGLSKSEDISSAQEFAKSNGSSGTDPYMGYLAGLSASSASKKITSDTFKSPQALTDSNGDFTGFKLDGSGNPELTFSKEKLEQYVKGNTPSSLENPKNWQDLKENVKKSLIKEIETLQNNNNSTPAIDSFMKGLQG